jgi:hypothetical protein
MAAFTWQNSLTKVKTLSSSVQTHCDYYHISSFLPFKNGTLTKA